MPKPDLVVALRAYPGLSKSPAYFTDKREMWRATLHSLHAALEGLRTKIHLLLDACPDIYADDAIELLPGRELVFHKLPKTGNQGTWKLQLDLLSAEDCEHVYLAEDDYLYVPGAFAKALAFSRNHPDVDFISLFDHPGWYYGAEIDPVDRHPLRWHGDRHWRTAVCTTCSFLAKTDSLRRFRPAFDTFTRGAFDMSMWMMITRHFLTSPRFFLRVLTEPVMAKIWRSAWRKGWSVLPRIPKGSLWGPMPSLATHLEAVDLAKGVEWEPIARAAPSASAAN